MAIEQTLSIIKPDAIRRGLSGKINARFEESDLKIVAQKRIHMTKEQAEKEAYKFGCEGAHQMGDKWMPCSMHKHNH